MTSSRLSALAVSVMSLQSVAQTNLCVTERDCGAGSYCYQNRCFPLPGSAPAPATPAAATTPPPAAQPTPAAPAPTVTPAEPTPAPAVAAPAAEPKATANPERPATTAVERVRGRFGLGFVGTHVVPIGYGAPTGTVDSPGIAMAPGASGLTDSLAVPTVGGLYWTGAAFGPVKALGILVGVGLMSRGSGVQIEQPGQSTQTTGAPPLFGMAFHVGLPLAVASGEHTLISLAPEVTVGFTTGVVRPGAGVTAPAAALSGSTVRVGARASAEIFLGFIGLPEVSLEAGFRLGVAVDSANISVGAAQYTAGSTVLMTSLEGTPWNVFTSSIAARYYF